LDDDGSGLLPGERLLWSGGPARARVAPAEAGFSLYLLGVLAVMAVAAPHIVRHMPRLFIAMLVIAWGGALIQAVAMLVNLLVIRPAIRRRSAYQVTDYRVAVTTGLRTRRTWSAYLDQIDEPTVKRRRDGTDDLLLQASQGRPLFKLFTGRYERVSFQPVGQSAIPVLRSLTDASQAQREIVAARRRMLDGMDGVSPPVGLDVSAPIPAVIGLTAGERVLWTGRPQRVPWWFGPPDVYLSLFALVWLVFAGLMCALAASGGDAAFLAVLVPFAAAGGLYPAGGRLVQRRTRISRSSYALTDQQLITVWQFRGQPVVVQASLRSLLPPEIRAQTIFTVPARPDATRRGNGWKNLAWPAATTGSPALVGLRDPQAVRDLICAAQLAARARRVLP
jgi:hypothetical protein